MQDEPFTYPPSFKFDITDNCAHRPIKIYRNQKYQFLKDNSERNLLVDCNCLPRRPNISTRNNVFLSTEIKQVTSNKQL